MKWRELYSNKEPFTFYPQNLLSLYNDVAPMTLRLVFYNSSLRMFHRKFFSRVQCFFMPILIVLVYSFSYFLVGKSPKSVPVPYTTTLRTFYSLGPTKYVTKSLAELQKMDALNKHVLFVNSVPNSGAEVLIFLLQKLQGVNSFRHVRLKGHSKVTTKIQQEKFVEEVYEIIRNAAIPLSFDRQIGFVNFSTFDRQSPTYVNLIRDPADKTSRLLHKDAGLIRCLQSRNPNCDKKIKPIHLTIPYFCGHQKNCWMPNSKWALEIAKHNVDKYYPVVGVLEELNATLELLEEKMPYFFQGVQKLYHNKILDKFNRRKIRQTNGHKTDNNNLNKLLSREYEFYDWIKQRLFQQLQLFYGEHNHP